jgi:alpha/beta superfamily hydrolase
MTPGNWRSGAEESTFVGGTLDDICPMDALVKFYESLPNRDKHLTIIPTDHFYGGREKEIVQFISEQVSPP